MCSLNPIAEVGLRGFGINWNACGKGARKFAEDEGGVQFLELDRRLTLLG